MPQADKKKRRIERSDDAVTLPDVIDAATLLDVVDAATLPDVVDAATLLDVVDDATLPDVVDDATLPDVVDHVTLPVIVDDATLPDVVDDATVHIVSTTADATSPITSTDATADDSIVAVPVVASVTNSDAGEEEVGKKVALTDNSEHYEALSALEKSMHIPMCQIFDCAGHPLFENELQGFFHSDGFCKLSPEDMEDIAARFIALAAVCRKSKA